MTNNALQFANTSVLFLITLYLPIIVTFRSALNCHRDFPRPTSSSLNKAGNFWELVPEITIFLGTNGHIRLYTY